jgi:hypothetical protein
MEQPFWPLLSGKGVCGRRWMPFPYVRKFILGLMAIGIENGEEAVPVIVGCLFFFVFYSIKKERKSEKPCVFVYPPVITRLLHLNSRLTIS